MPNSSKSITAGQRWNDTRCPLANSLKINFKFLIAFSFPVVFKIILVSLIQQVTQAASEIFRACFLSASKF